MQDITWPFPMNAATQSKDVWKGGSTSSPIWELVGVDGTNQGALLPHPGFREAWVFRYDLLSGSDFGGTNPYATNPNRAIVIDFWTFTCRIGSSSYCYGVVYLAQRPSSATRDLIIEGYRTDSSSYFQKLIIDGAGGSGSKLGTSYTDYGIDVVPTPRAVYVFTRGVAPSVVKFPTGSVVITSAGPGVAPNGSWVSTNTTGAFVPTSTQLPNPTTAGNPPGSFVVYGTSGGTYPDSTSGSPSWTDSSARWTSASSQKAGDYAFAVQFEDSLTGRRSQLSASVAVTFTGADRKFTVVGIVDTNKYDTVKIWRSVRNTNAAGIFTASILQLEATFLASSQPLGGTAPATNSLGGTAWAYAVQKDDRQLVMQDTFQDKPAFLSNVPYGGTAAAYQNQMYVSDIQGEDPDIKDQMRSVGEIRWSSPTDGSYELFAPKGRWVPEMFGDIPIAFQQAGQLLVGFSSNRVYFIARDGAYVRVTGAHSGYGVTSKYAAASIGPMIYYVTHQGVRAVYPDGRLDEVGALDWLISKGWEDDLSRVSMAFDPKTTALYILNPVQERAACMWFSSGTVSEIHQLPFTKCVRGLFPRTTGGALDDRALFLLSPTDIYHTAGTTGFRARLMIHAEGPTDRYRTPPVGNQYEGVHYGLLDANCDRCVSADYTTQALPAGSENWQITWDKRTDGWSPDWTCLGCYVNIVGETTTKSSGSEMTQVYQFNLKIIGLNSAAANKQCVVAKIVDGPTTSTGQDLTLHPLLTSINPVAVKVQTSILPGPDEAGGYMVGKQVASVGALFSGCDQTDAVSDKSLGYLQFSRWFANLYKGENETPTAKGYSYNPTAQDNTMTIVDGPTPIHASWNQGRPVGSAAQVAMGPQFSVEFVAFAVCQTFRLLALNVKGRILGTERDRNNYG